MWTGIEERIEENERELAVPLRSEFLVVLRTSGLRPGERATKKMVALEFGIDERLLWQIENSAQHFYLHQKWQSSIELAGFSITPFPYDEKMKDGGRHTALSRKWAFGESNCVQLKLDTVEELRKLVNLLQSESGTIKLDPAAIDRWIARLRLFFPSLERFDQPDAGFDVAEREYKLDTAKDLRSLLESAKTDQAVSGAIVAAASESNMLDWRTYLPLTLGSDADRTRLEPALAALARAAIGPPAGHPAALEAFASVWREAVPNGSVDSARQIGEFLFIHLWPDDGIYLRQSVRQDLWLEGVGYRFPYRESLADTYLDELKFSRAVKRAFEDRGLGPRDMLDVQSALWVVYKYSDEQEAASALTRVAVESAMDAFDRFRDAGEQNEVFERFGDPRDYWVRSTRNRPNRVYPSKPIVGFIRGKAELNGGWGQKADAAARLHNSGYVIVDKDNQPVTPPKKYDHLIREADRIRLCAKNYFIEPAREAGLRQVEIRVRELADDMGLQNVFPSICDALGGEKFQRLSNVPAPTHTLPNPSSSTVFTYQLDTTEMVETMKEASPASSHSSTNLIFYGPPGTGKTYATVWEAVRLCIGEAAALPLRADRGALLSEYRRLAGEGRIEFVTFHQSFSYEEFVEGLRPTTDVEASEGEEGIAVTTGGFRLEARAGVFKVLSERARLDTGGATADRLDRSRPIYKVALGQRQNQEDRILEGLDKSIIHIGWGSDVDWSDGRFDDFEEIRKEWNAKKDPAATGKDPNIEITYAFRSGLQVGDYVIISDGRDIFRAFGRVTGEYEYDPNASFHPHRRSVQWIWRDDKGVERSSFYPRNFRRQTAYRLNPSLIDWDALESIVLGLNAEHPASGARAYVLIIDEINRANISKVFGELITLLEADKRLGCQNELRVRLPYSGTSFGVPPNLHVIGTMNTADRSIALLDSALRRRFAFRELMPDISALREALAQRKLDVGNLDGIDLEKLLTTLNDRIEFLFDRDHQIGHAYFTGCRSRADIEEVMRHKVIPLLAEYFYEDWSKVAAVLGDRAGAPKFYFLEARKLVPPLSVPEEELGGEKLCWSIKASFDFTEFSA